MINSKHILAGMLLLQTGCAHHAYKPQRIEVRKHVLVLHESRVAMENAYTMNWRRDPEKIGMEERGTYFGFFIPKGNELHCYVPWPEKCMLHEYKHLGVKYGLEIPDDPHFKRRK